MGIFEQADTDGSGKLDIGEFEQMLESKQVQAHFQTLGLHISDAWGMFRILDQDSSLTVNRNEFITGCVRLKINASKLDVEMVMAELTKMSGIWHKAIHRMQRQLDDVSDHILEMQDAKARSIGGLSEALAGVMKREDTL